MDAIFDTIDPVPDAKQYSLTRGRRLLQKRYAMLEEVKVKKGEKRSVRTRCRN